MDLARIELASQQCECRVLPLDYRPIYEPFYYRDNRGKIKLSYAEYAISCGKSVSKLTIINLDTDYTNCRYDDTHTIRLSDNLHKMIIFLASLHDNIFAEQNGIFIQNKITVFDLLSINLDCPSLDIFPRLPLGKQSLPCK